MLLLDLFLAELGLGIVAAAGAKYLSYHLSVFSLCIGNFGFFHLRSMEDRRSQALVERLLSVHVL